MSTFLPRAFALAAALLAGHASATLTLYGRDDFRGARVSLRDAAPDFREFGFNDRASSLVVEGEPWEVCKDTMFRSRCVVLTPGHYPNLDAMGMDERLSSARPVQRIEHRPVPPAPAAQGDVVLFEHVGFHGRGFGATSSLRDFREFGFNDRVSSLVVFEGRWEACEHIDFGGRCVRLRPGRYPDLVSMGLNDTLSSLRRVRHHGGRHDDDDDDDDGRYGGGHYAPAPQPVYDWRRRPSEELEQVPVESVRAVYATPQQQRCWVEQERSRGDGRVAGAVIGGVIGGILGHQVGEGRDVATVGGVVAGAVIGSQVGRHAEAQRPVTRCADAPAERPDYYDVTYRYRGMQHHVQMTQPPGPTLVVNRRGEPRL